MPPKTNTNKVDINAVNATTGKSNAQVLAEAGAVLNQSLKENPNPNITPVNVPVTNTTITSNNLKSTPNVVIPDPVNNTSARNNLGVTATGVGLTAEQNLANLATANNQSTAQTERQSYADKLKEAIGIQGTKGDFTLQAQKEAGLSDATKALTDVNNEALTVKAAYEKQIKDIEGSAGKTVSQVQAEQDALRGRANEELANIGIRQMVAQNNLTGAQKIVDDKVSAKFEPIANQIQSYGQLIDIIDSDPTEKARLQSILQEKQAKFENNQTAYKTALNNAVNNGAPQAILNAIDNAASLPNATAASILASAGSYGVDKSVQLDNQYKQAQINKINEDIRAAKIPITITNPNAGQYSQALNVILGSGTFTKDQKASIVNAVNNGQDPFTVIKNQAKNLMGQTLATDLDKSETALAQLNILDSAIKDYYSKGGKTDVFSGNYEKVLNKLGNTSNPELAGIATEIALAMQSYRLAVTGTAASVQEDARIDNVFPGITSGQVLNNARTQATVKSFQNKVDIAYRNTLGATYDALKNSNVSPTITPVQPAPEIATQSGTSFFSGLLNLFKSPTKKTETKPTGSIYNPSTGTFNIPKQP